MASKDTGKEKAGKEKDKGAASLLAALDVVETALERGDIAPPLAAFETAEPQEKPWSK